MLTALNNQAVAIEPPSISVIVPVYNNPKDLRECLAAIVAAPALNKEIIVVDDGSTDDTPSVATEYGVRLLRLAQNSGVSVARNFGARHAQGDILFFVDSDVVIPSGAVESVVRLFQQDSELAAMFGSYDTKPRARATVSRYRNLLHHYVHQTGSTEASTFWAGCGAVRRSAFEAVGGFDEVKYRYPSIEDIELGYRLRNAGGRIFLDKSLQATHLKRWTLNSVIRTDVTRRALPWARLILESTKAPDDLNLKLAQRLSGVLVMLACGLLVLSLLWPQLLLVAAAALLVVIALNRDLYRFFLRQGGLLFGLACIPLHFLYYFYSVLSYAYVLIEFRVNALGLLRHRSVGRLS